MQDTAITADLVAAHEFGRLRILVVGAGVAGLTLAALLRQRNESPFVIERMQDINDSGYNLAMYPLGVRALHSLGLHGVYRRRSVPIDTYSLHTGNGRCRKQYPLGAFIQRYGSYQGITRRELIDTLREAVGELPLYCGHSVIRLSQNDACATATFADGSAADFDLIVAADGLYSDTRGLLLDDGEYRFRDTGWSCWTTWADAGDFRPGEITEYWGKGCFAGAYPVKNSSGVVLGGPRRAIERSGRKAFIDSIQRRVQPGSPVQVIARAFESADDVYLWKLCDCRSQAWHKGRVVLLGDAATGILPTAGVGASVAMDSAAALSDEISRADAQHIEYALRLFEKRQKHRAETAQANSRQLSRLMLLDSTLLASLRDALVPFYSLSRALREIANLMEA